MSEVVNLCEEIRLTEAAYVDDLRAMLTVFVRPARKLDMLSEKEKAAIFSNIEELLLPAEALLEKLQREGEPVSTIAEAFIGIAPFFKLYCSYCQNYTLALSTLRKLQGAGPFAEYLASQSARKEAKGLPLEAFLIKPVQRLTKYPLFFHGLLKVRAASHTPDAPLASASAE